MESTLVLKSIRARRNITQEEIASKLEVSRQTYVNCENNILNEELSTIFKIFNIVSISDSEMLDFFKALKQDFVSYKKDNNNE